MGVPDLFYRDSFIPINFKVAYAKKDLQADVILDMATLTGAQGVATGRYHGAVLTNKEVWEPACMAAGKASGDLVVSTFCNCHLTISWRFCRLSQLPSHLA